MRGSRLVWLAVFGLLAATYYWATGGSEPPVPTGPESGRPAVATDAPAAAIDRASQLSGAETATAPGEPAVDAGDSVASEKEAWDCLDAIETAEPDFFGGNRRRIDSGLNSLTLDVILGTAHRELSHSSDPEHRLAAAMFAPIVELSEEEFMTLLTPDTGNVLVAWHGLRLCLEHPAGTCPFEDAFARELILLDSGNSEVWAQVAVSRYRRGDDEGALDALMRAAATSQSTSYWLETTELMERALIASTGLETRQRVALALGGYDSPDYGALEGMCRETAEAGNDWSKHCLALGELMEREYRTELGRSMGRSLRLTVFRAEGFTDGEISARLGSPEYETQLTYAQDVVVQAMIRTSATQFYRYLDAAREFGETEGKLRYLENEIGAFLELIGLEECGPVLLGDRLF